MDELVKIEERIISNEKVPTVSARELWEKLESGWQFSDWIKSKIDILHLIENEHFVSFQEILKREIGATTRKEYYVVLDIAKQIALMEGNDKGTEIRQYFIDYEKKSKDLILQLRHEIEKRDKLYKNPVVEMAINYVIVKEQQEKMIIEQLKIKDEQIRQMQKQIELQKEQDNIKYNIKVMESKQSAILDDDGFFSVQAFANLKGIKITKSEAAVIGKRATFISNQMGIKIGKISDGRYGKVNSYTKEVLDMAFNS